MAQVSEALRHGLPVGVIADVHGNLLALQAVLGALSAWPVACIVHLGDCAWGPLNPAGTLDLMRRAKVLSIAGNQDREGLEALREHDRDWLSALLPLFRVPDELLLCHGTPFSDTTYLLHEATQSGVRARMADKVQELIGDTPERLILCGHTHLAGLIELPSGQVVANPGSVGLPAYSDESPWPHVMEAGSPEARFGILVGGNLSFHSVPYDYESAALLAERNGCPDWGHQLRTGRVASGKVAPGA